MKGEMEPSKVAHRVVFSEHPSLHAATSILLSVRNPEPPARLE
jgi:hypothetical protein